MHKIINEHSMKKLAAILVIVAVLAVIGTLVSCSSNTQQSSSFDTISGKIVKRSLPFPVVFPISEKEMREKLRNAENVFAPGRKVPTQQRVSAVAVCGDGTTAGLEQCDDGNNNTGDGCSPTCRIELCGDGIIDPDGPDNAAGNADDEQCDDGNAINTDSCTASCRTAVCGDGFVQSGVEQCDDGNTLNGDWCSPTCRFSSPESD